MPVTKRGTSKETQRKAKRRSEAEGLQQSSSVVPIIEPQCKPKRRRISKAEGLQQSSFEVLIVPCEIGSLTERFFKSITQPLMDFGRSKGGNALIALGGSPKLESFLKKHFDKPSNCGSLMMFTRVILSRFAKKLNEKLTKSYRLQRSLSGHRLRSAEHTRNLPCQTTSNDRM